MIVIKEYLLRIKLLICVLYFHNIFYVSVQNEIVVYDDYKSLKSPNKGTMHYEFDKFIIV